jgi:succinoglycan biosynthesis transport protein ExoP
MSPFSDRLRDLKTSVELARAISSVRCIAISSLGAKEGKSTIAGHLARLFADSGTSTILIDANLANTTISKAWAPKAQKGLLDVLSGNEPLANAIVRRENTSLHLLPASTGSVDPLRNELIGSQRMRDLLSELGGQYDLIVVDLPALQSGADARAISPYIDSFVFVAEWGRTSVDVLSEAARFLAAKQVNLLGVVINKIDPRVIRRMRDHGDTYYI